MKLRLDDVEVGGRMTWNCWPSLSRVHPARLGAMRTIDDMPNEILILIFNHIPLLPSDCMSSISLVCRRWRVPAQDALFRDVRVVSQNVKSKWLALPATALRSRTRSVRTFFLDDALVVGCDGHLVSLDVNRLDVGDATLIHPYKSDLRSLTVQNDIFGGFPEHLPPLRLTLLFLWGSLPDPSQQSIPFLFQPADPTLTYLPFDSFSFADANSICRLASPSLSHLQHLELQHLRLLQTLEIFLPTLNSLLPLTLRHTNPDVLRLLLAMGHTSLRKLVVAGGVNRLPQLLNDELELSRFPSLRWPVLDWTPASELGEELLARCAKRGVAVECKGGEFL